MAAGFMKPWSSGRSRKRGRTRGSWRRKGRVGAMQVTGQVSKEGVERGRMTPCFPAGTGSSSVSLDGGPKDRVDLGSRT